MKKALGELVTFKNPMGLHLDGILYQDHINRGMIVHVHGSFGNFYQNHFIRLMARSYLDAGINFLSFNMSGHDGVAEGYRHKDNFEYVGGSLVDFIQGVYDIEGAVDFARQFTDRVILQGHSLGCDRILNFILTRSADHEFILLGPCDSYQLQAKWIAPETVEQQIARLKKETPVQSEFDWLPSREYGIKQDDWTYPIPVTRKALLSIMEGPVFRLIRLGSPAQFKIDQRALVYIGGKDALQTASSEEMFRYLKERIRDVQRVYT